jgi:hypothetical protein
MCARFEVGGVVHKPGDEVRAFSVEGEVCLPWAGFARAEILGWWRRQGGVLLDVPAERFAERADDDGALIWDGVPPGLVIRALRDPRGARPLLKVVTRQATPEELGRFRHPRMPLLEEPLFPGGTGGHGPAG